MRNWVTINHLLKIFDVILIETNYDVPEVSIPWASTGKGKRGHLPPPPLARPKK